MTIRKVKVTCDWYVDGEPTAEDWGQASTRDLQPFWGSLMPMAYESLAADYVEECDDEPGDHFDSLITAWIKDGEKVVCVVVHREEAIKYYGTVKP